MAYYGQLNIFESFLMGLIVIITNFSALPSVLSLWRKGDLQFEAIMILLSMGTSVMYHLCEVIDSDIYLSQYEWHRLDNVFAITCSSMFALHLLGNGHARKIMYFTLMITILVEEKDPWSFQYTFGVITLFSIFSVILRAFYWNTFQVQYDYKRTAASIISLLIGGLFFITALDFKNDYLRFKHGMWHMFAFISIYFAMSCTNWREKQKKNNKLKDEKQLIFQEQLLIRNQN